MRAMQNFLSEQAVQCHDAVPNPRPVRTCITRGIIPGWVGVPCIVWVFPEEVTPYAKIVTVFVW